MGMLILAMGAIRCVMSNAAMAKSNAPKSVTMVASSMGMSVTMSANWSAATVFWMRLSSAMTAIGLMLMDAAALAPSRTWPRIVLAEWLSQPSGPPTTKWKNSKFLVSLILTTTQSPSQLLASRRTKPRKRTREISSVPTPPLLSSRFALSEMARQRRRTGAPTGSRSKPTTAKAASAPGPARSASHTTSSTTAMRTRRSLSIRPSALDTRRPDSVQERSLPPRHRGHCCAGRPVEAASRSGEVGRSGN
jgi:hypothetical protein